MAVLHPNLTSNQLHDSKGLSSAADKTYNHASSGVNSWETLIGTGTATASASSSLDITGLSKYSVIILSFQDLLPAASSTLRLYVSSDNGSTFSTSSIYYSGINQDGTGEMQSVFNAGLFIMGITNDTRYATGKLIINNFNQAVPTSVVGHTAHTTDANFTTGISNRDFRGFINSNTAWNALRLVQSTGNITSGSVVIEGIKS